MTPNVSSDTENNKPKRARSPNFPFVSLEMGVQRLASLDAYFGRHPVPANKAGLAWNMKGDSSQAGQTLAALKAFGFVEYSGSGDSLQATLTNDARTYLRAQQNDIKQDVLRRAAKRPKLIAEYLGLWGVDRPPDPVCLDKLVLEGGFTEPAADTFLKVYDATVGFAKLADSDTVSDAAREPAVDYGQTAERMDQTPPANPPPPPPSLAPRKDRGVIMEGERELTTGLLSKEASFRLIVSGTIGEKEIDRLIRKLELDKEILAESAAASAKVDRAE